MYYTYVLIDPRNEQPFYVGKGIRNRMYNHGKKVTPNSYLYNKIQKIKSLGLDIIYEKWFEGDEEFCIWMEIYLISEFGKENLCNMTNGGEGGLTSTSWKKGHPSCGNSTKMVEISKSPEGRAKRSETMTKLWQTPSFIKIREDNKLRIAKAGAAGLIKRLKEDPEFAKQHSETVSKNLRIRWAKIKNQQQVV
jgi:hypothetical protein